MHNRIASGLYLQYSKTGHASIVIVVEYQTRKQDPKEQYQQPDFPEKEQEHTDLNSEMPS